MNGRLRVSLAKAGFRIRRRGGEAGQASRGGGFTLIELMIVLAMVLILVSMAVANYTLSIKRSREAVLRENLFTLRKEINEYTLDKQKAPQTLDDLVSAGYLKKVPIDPMTNAADWVVEQEDVLLSVDQQNPGITDVHSASVASASDGTAYNTW